jgi:PPOX class probable F420-dependent enzyme
VDARVARLATADGDGVPHAVPVTFAVIDGRVVIVVDGKPKSTTRLKRLANITANPGVALVVDHYDEDWSTLWWVRVDGRATIETAGPAYEAGVAALRAKYAQYREGVATDGPLIVIEPQRVTGWSAR